MKNTIAVILLGLFSINTVNAYAWGKKKEEAPKTVKAVKAVAEKTAAVQTPEATEKPKVIRFEKLIALLLNEGVATSLGITEEQKAKIVSAKDGMAKELREVKVDFNAKTEEYRKEFEKQIEPFKVELEEKVNKVKQEKINELNSVLTPEQQKKLADVLNNPAEYIKK